MTLIYKEWQITVLCSDYLEIREALEHFDFNGSTLWNYLHLNEFSTIHSQQVNMITMEN